MASNTAPHTLSCCIEAPPAYVPKARYALEMLLGPLGIDPRWVGRDALAAGGLYYGPHPDGLPAGVLVRPLRPETIAFFERRTAYEASRVPSVTWEQETWPVLFDDGTPYGDLVASAFFWLSGWQEYVVPTRDAHGRFPHAASLQAALGTTARPVVDAYREMLAGQLRSHGIPVARRSWQGHRWALCPTHDIDYLRKWRPGILYREVVHYAVQNRRRVPPAGRIRRLGTVLADWLRPGDPCRTAFERMQAEVTARGGTATYFLKAAARDPHDVAYPVDAPYLRRRVDALRAEGFEIGLHPSYPAHTNRAFLEEERDRLARVAGGPLTSVRQHYLRYEGPLTSRLHAELGFRIDSTLGFAEHEGFRHGTCLPFRIYDVDADAPLDVWEMPLAVMESALFNRRGLQGDAARAATAAVLQACRRFGGVCVALWHNTLWDEMDYPGWGRHFLETLDAAQAEGALVASLRDALDASGFRA